jgi:hypothetical protein
MVMVPPYCGTPSESHQCPVDEAEVVAPVVEAAVVLGAVEVVFVVVVVLEVLTVDVVVVVVVEDVPQDDKIMEVASRQHKINSVIFPFILSPLIYLPGCLILTGRDIPCSSSFFLKRNRFST